MLSKTKNQRLIRSIREFPQFAGRKSSEISNGYDLISVSTPHDDFREIDFETLIVPASDTRNVVKYKNRLFYRYGGTNE